MTYSIDIINLCFNYLHENKKKVYIKCIKNIIKFKIQKLNTLITIAFNDCLL